MCSIKQECLWGVHRFNILPFEVQWALQLSTGPMCYWHVGMVWRSSLFIQRLGEKFSVFRQFEAILYNPSNTEDTASKSFPERTISPDSKIAAVQIWPTRAKSGPNKPELARCTRCLVNSANWARHRGIWEAVRGRILGYIPKMEENNCWSTL